MRRRASRTQPVDRAHEDDAIQHRNAEQSDQSYRRGQVQIETTNPQRPNAPDQREWNIPDHEQRLAD
jgi:hypothetical protein